MEVGNIGGKIKSTFYNNAEIIGLGAGVLDFGWDNLVANITAISTGQAGIPNMTNLVSGIISPATAAGQKTWLGIQIIIGGYLLKEVGFGGGLGNALEKLGKGFIFGNIVQDVLDAAVHDHY